MSPVLALSDDNLAAWNEIISHYIVRNIFVMRENYVGLAAGSLETDIVIMALEPVVTVISVSKEAQVFDFCNFASGYFDDVVPHLLKCDSSLRQADPYCKFILFLQILSYYSDTT